MVTPETALMAPSSRELPITTANMTARVGVLTSPAVIFWE